MTHLPCLRARTMPVFLRYFICLDTLVWVKPRTRPISHTQSSPAAKRRFRIRSRAGGGGGVCEGPGAGRGSESPGADGPDVEDIVDPEGPAGLEDVTEAPQFRGGDVSRGRCRPAGGH